MRTYNYKLFKKKKKKRKNSSFDMYEKVTKYLQKQR